MTKLSTKTTDQQRAGRATAVADFNAGRFHMPIKGDAPAWAQGYRDAVQELAGTFGKDAVRRAGGAV